jgi:hypothetical protein
MVEMACSHVFIDPSALTLPVMTKLMPRSSASENHNGRAHSRKTDQRYQPLLP